MTSSPPETMVYTSSGEPGSGRQDVVCHLQRDDTPSSVAHEADTEKMSVFTNAE